MAIESHHAICGSASWIRGGCNGPGKPRSVGVVGGLAGTSGLGADAGQAEGHYGAPVAASKATFVAVSGNP